MLQKDDSPSLTYPLIMMNHNNSHLQCPKLFTSIIAVQFNTFLWTECDLRGHAIDCEDGARGLVF
ncbi:Hypothetical predicted protein [Podarcis lilfordi]|uniref:Uncharacterized protein n=1 Tax=Podarcis lilfordi TaxID=74358 RepID=A0AA35LGK2_9SAUR|nr:Hypothetical predicted protein [Podarcis lilfordi]